jgi:4-hydroxybenzoate polyprenyltransferase
MLLVAILPLIGFTFAYWDHGCFAPGWTAMKSLVFLAVIWAVPHAGTMWLNAGLDRDEKATLFGDAVEVPKHVEVYGYVTLLFSLGAALWTSVPLFLCVAGCAVLSVLYSHPKTAWKGHAILGPAANAIGYGVLSPLGGFFLADLPPTMRGLLVLVTAVPWILAAYFGAQAFQHDEDLARGYRTLVATHGATLTLKVTRACLWIALVLTLGASALGWFPRLVLVSAPLFLLVDRVLVLWLRVPGGGDASWAKRFFVRLVAAGLVILALVSVDFELERRTSGLAAGLTTASGRFEPRICDPR